MQNFFWPPGDAGNLLPPVVPAGGATAANQVIEIGLLTSIDANTLPPGQATMANSSPVVIASDQSAIAITAATLPLPAGAATAAKQDTGNASLASIDTKLTSPLAVTGPLTDAELRATAVPVSLASVPLPTGAATAANQATEIASLSSIDSKLTSPLAVTGPLTDTQLRASAVPVSLASSPLPTGAATEATLLAFSDKTAGAFVPEAFDYAAITYVGATTDIDTVTYKLGGAGGTIVALLTLGYDGSSRLTSVTKT